MQQGKFWAWKGLDRAAMERLHAKGMIGDPVGGAKSVVLTEQGNTQCEALFRKHFGRQNLPPPL